VYFIFVLIDLLALSPVAGTEYADHAISIGKTHRENAFANPTEAIVPFLGGTVGGVFGNDAARIKKSELRLDK